MDLEEVENSVKVANNIPPCIEGIGCIFPFLCKYPGCLILLSLLICDLLIYVQEYATKVQKISLAYSEIQNFPLASN